MTLEEELVFYKKNVISLLDKNSKLEQNNAALEARNWNLKNKLESMETERNKLSSKIEELNEKNKLLNTKASQINNELLNKIKLLEAENKDIKSKAIKLQQVYNEQLDKYYEQCMSEIVKARNDSRRKEVLECLKRNNGNKTRTAEELSMSRQAVYQHIKKDRCKQEVDTRNTVKSDID